MGPARAAKRSTVYALLSEILSACPSAFPPLYSSLLKTAAKIGRLPLLLPGLGRHIVFTERLLAEVRRSATYPLVILLALGAVLVFFGMHVAPDSRELILELELGRDMPWISSAVFASRVVPWVIVPLMGLALMTMVGGLLHPRMREWLGVSWIGCPCSSGSFEQAERQGGAIRWGRTVGGLAASGRSADVRRTAGRPAFRTRQQGAGGAA